MNPITLDEKQAAVHYAALDKAVAVVEELMALKSSRLYRPALGIELLSYLEEKERLATAFPVLNSGQGDAS